MPIYEYHCEKCGVFELTRRITERALKHCPTCKGKVERLMSSTSFVLKGSGWYATDYARSGSQPKPDSTATDSGANGAAADSSSTSDATAKAAASDPAPKTAVATDSAAKTPAPESPAKTTGKAKSPVAKSTD